MALRGLWQLKRLLVSFCDFSGSSKGARDFALKGQLEEFIKNNPQIRVHTAITRGQHPFVRGSYANTSEHTIGVKNQDSNGVLEAALSLRNATGRKTTLALGTRQVTRRPSIQGTWTPFTKVGDTPVQIKVEQ
jgi:large subunit ribosomal protein L43